MKAGRWVVGLIVVLAVVVAIRWGSSPEEMRTRQFEFTYVARIPHVPTEAGKLRLWIPLPPSSEYQEISDLRIDSPVTLERHQEMEYGNRYVYLEGSVKKLPEPLEVTMRFRTTRREHQVALDRGNGTVRAAGQLPPELQRHLEPDRLVPTDGLIAALAEQETRGLQDPLDKARAVYDFVISTMRYDKSGEGWGRGDALYACNARQGNCTDFHALFIGMMRAAGIPARFEIGFPLPPDQTEGEIGGYHCWAQFYVEPYGWIPVDASEAWKHPQQRDYFFGAHDPHRVLFTVGRDIRLQPAQDGEPLNYFVYPYVELDGKPFGQVETSFAFRDLAPSSPEVQ